MKQIFKRDYLLKELNLPKSAIERKCIDQSQQETFWEIIFIDKGKYWATRYYAGYGEEQFNPYDWGNEVECEEVEKKIIQVETWVPVQN